MARDLTFRLRLDDNVFYSVLGKQQRHEPLTLSSSIRPRAPVEFEHVSLDIQCCGTASSHQSRINAAEWHLCKSSSKQIDSP